MDENITIFSTSYCGKFKPKDGQIYLRACYWYRRLFSKALSMFEIVGAPETWNNTAVEYRLMTQGAVIVSEFKSEKYGDGIYALPGAWSDFDPYGFPKKTRITNIKLGTKTGTVGVDSVILRSNKMVSPVIPHINQYAETLAQIDVGIYVNLSNLNSTRVFKVSNDKEAQAVRKMMDLATGGQPAVNIKKVHLGDDKDDKFIFSDGVDYNVHNYLEDKIPVIAEFDSIFGVEYQPIEKGGNMITTELIMSNRDLEVNKAFWLEARNEDLEKVNKIFGTNIEYKLRDIDREEVANIGDDELFEQEAADS